MKESSADEMNPVKLFSCETVNVTFAVVNRYGASALSPAVTMCGGGMILQVHHDTLPGCPLTVQNHLSM